MLGGQFAMMVLEFFFKRWINRESRLAHETASKIDDAIFLVLGLFFSPTHIYVLDQHSCISFVLCTCLSAIANVQMYTALNVDTQTVIMFVFKVTHQSWASLTAL